MATYYAHYGPGSLARVFLRIAAGIPQYDRERQDYAPESGGMNPGQTISKNAKMVAPHPLDPLSVEEMIIAAEVVRAAEQSPIKFRVITLEEPPKSQLVEVLDSTQAERMPVLERIARVDAYVERLLCEFKVNVETKTIIQREELHGRHSFIDPEYMKQVEIACLEDENVQREIEALDIPEHGKVVVEPWAYAPDGLHDIRERVTMAYFYLTLSPHPDANYYAYPLTLCAEVSDALKVVKILHLPTGADEHSGGQRKTYSPRKEQQGSEYHPDLCPEHRKTTKPLLIQQPQGPSFVIEGQLIRWEKWTMRVGFNYREGMTLHDVRYNGRSLFYRLSLSEMFVPYGDSRYPFPRKAAFDVGNDGAGLNANNLRLGCDCLGTIKYFDAWHTTGDGIPIKMPHVICCHEIDDGVLWKHTNFRTGHPVVARSRVLVLQTIITVTNYEYIFCFYFGQDASMHYEVRATGILSTAPIEEGGLVPFGTVIAPGVMAPYHQHLFCLRIDPAIDGHKNSLVIEESHSLPAGASNPFGAGYTTTSETVPAETGLDLDFTKNRVFKIVNESKVNPITGTPVGFKLLPCYSQMLLARPESLHAKRSEFASHALWVTRYSDQEFFPAGKYTMQSSGGEGIASWIARGKSVRNEDIVIWHTFGSTHNPRIEDWPVMPCEKMIVGLKPVNFFSRSPAMDVAVAAPNQDVSAEVGVAECQP